MTRFHNINGKRIQFTAAEETARNQRETENKIVSQAKKDAEANAIAKKASGKQKLLDLGLSEEEVKALIGV